MDSIESLKWGAIISGIGIFLGWFLNQLGIYWRAKSDDKRTLRQVLFNLLEVHNLLSRFATDGRLTMIVNQIIKRLPPEENTQQTRDYLFQVLSKSIPSYLENITSEELEGMEEKYMSAIADLARIDPIRAFYLSDKTKTLDKFKTVENWVGDFYKGEESESNKVTSAFRPILVIDTLSDLKVDIKSIALRISIVMRWRVGRLLNTWSKEDPEGDSRLDEMITSLISKMQTQ